MSEGSDGGPGDPDAEVQEATKNEELLEAARPTRPTGRRRPRRRPPPKAMPSTPRWPSTSGRWGRSAPRSKARARSTAALRPGPERHAGADMPTKFAE